MRILNRLTVALLLCAASTVAIAQAPKAGPAADYPNKPVRWVIPFPPGGSVDAVARLVGQKLGETLGQQFVLDNRSGAGGSLAGQLVARAAPDGYTLLVANPGPSINNPLLSKDTGYRVADFEPIVFMTYTPLVLYANSALPANNARELIDYARANPDKLNGGSSGNGSSLHIGLALLQTATGARITHVPYKGAAPALNAVLSGQIQVMYTTLTTGLGHVKAGRVKILAIAGAKRLTAVPNVSTLAEQGIKGAEALSWVGMAGPAKTPRAIVERLNREVNKALALADVRETLDRQGLEIAGGSPQDFGAFIKVETAKLEKLVKAGLVQTE
jgi:tripartite-type tricarboxylate transporter receptor subunit TctC